MPISDPEIEDGSVVLFAPLIGLDFDDLPDAAIDAGFPLSWLWPSQLGGLEDPDIRRDWISRELTGLRPIACLALAAPGDFDGTLEPLRRRADTAVTALRLAGIAGFHDPDLLGVYARDGNGFRYRRPAVYRQTAITQRAQMSWPLDADEVADLTALWALLLEYEAGRRAPEIDHALALFRRAHVSLGLSRATRLELFFASLEAALGRGAADPLALLSGRAHVLVPSSFEWYAAHGVATRNALAHGEWKPDNDDDDALWALRHLTWLLGEVLPALLMAWRRRRKARPAKTLVAALRDPQADLDWRALAAPARELEPARYSGLDTSILIERARTPPRGRRRRRGAMVRERERSRRRPRRLRSRPARARRGGFRRRAHISAQRRRGRDPGGVRRAREGRARLGERRRGSPVSGRGGRGR